MLMMPPVTKMVRMMIYAYYINKSANNVHLVLNGKPVAMKVDTGATWTMM